MRAFKRSLRGFIFFFTFIFSNPTSADKLNSLPSTVDTMVRLVELAEWARLITLIEIPVTITETAYELGDGWCQPRYKTTRLNDSEELRSVLERLRRHWEERTIERLRHKTYGISDEGDCLHETLIEVDSDEQRIIGIILDARDNVWTEERENFRIKSAWPR